MSLDEMIITTSKKLGELQARVEEKSGLGNRYRELVIAKLAYFKEKIIELLKKQKQQLSEVRSETKAKMQGLNKTLTDLKGKEKQKGEDALKNATNEQAGMKNDLDEANKQVNKLKELLNQPNPDVEALKKNVEELNAQLQDARTGQAGAEAALKAAQRAVSDKEAIMDKSANELKAVLEMIEKIMKKVDGMSITNADLTDAMQKLGEIESILNQPENFIPPDDGGIVEGVKGLFEGVETEGAAFVTAAKDAEKEVEKAMNEDGLEVVETEKIVDETPQEDLDEKFQGNMIILNDNKKYKKTRKERRGLTDLVNKEKNRGELDKMLASAGQTQQTMGGMTRRRRHHKRSVKKGGYIIKKKNSSRKIKKKRGRRSSTSSSSTSSSKKSSSR